MTTEQTPGAPYLAQFAQVKAKLPGRRLSWLKDLRQGAIERFVSLGFPTLKIEEWKYTSLSPLTKTVFGPASQEANGRAEEGLRRFLLGEQPCHRLVFVNGRHRPDLSHVGSLPAGVTITSLAAVLEAEPELLEPHFGGEDQSDGQALVALNTAFMADGAVVKLAQGVALEAPVHLIFLATTQGGPAAHHPRNLILAEPGSSAAIFESYGGVGTESYWTNVVTQVKAGRNAAIRHYKLQCEGAEAFHIAITQADLESGSSYTSFVMSMGGRLSRNEIAARLNGTGVDCRLNGVYLARDRQHMDTSTRIEHAKPGGLSREVYKGVIDGEAHAVFHGKIVVCPDAQKTDAHQLNENLLLSERARIDTKPELEIHADDVKCSHGANAGELDSEALFYLRTRGLEEERARSLLIEAFVAEMIDGVETEAVRSNLRKFVSSWLPTVANGKGAA